MRERKDGSSIHPLMWLVKYGRMDRNDLQEILKNSWNWHKYCIHFEDYTLKVDLIESLDYES